MNQDQERKWYAVYSKPKKEEVARFHLQRKGLEVFYPRLVLPHALAGKGQIIPLFPNYLFVRCYAQECSYVIWSPGVKHLVSFNGAPASLDHEIVLFLAEKATPEGLLGASPMFTPGQEVRIASGPLAGLMGIIINPPDAKGRVGVLMQLLNRQIKVELPLNRLKGTYTMK